MMRSPRSGRSALVAVLLVSILASPAAVGKNREGEAVVFTGTVTDAAGQPVDGIRVLLEAARNSFAVSRLEKRERSLVRRSAVTDAEGVYRFEWSWHDYYNRFRVRIVSGGGSPATDREPRTIEVADLEKRPRTENPVVVNFALSDSAFVEQHRLFLDTIESAEQRSIYEQNGRPDRVEPGVGDTVTWFYFELGRAYRFERGALAASEEFEPVRSFPR